MSNSHFDDISCVTALNTVVPAQWRIVNLEVSCVAVRVMHLSLISSMHSSVPVSCLMQQL